MLDGITTHGHPRALLGALVYGYALHHAYRSSPSDEFENLFRTLITNVENWSNFISNNTITNDWVEQCKKIRPNYMNIWDKTRQEVIELLEICESNLVSDDQKIEEQVLEKLNCFDKNVGASGTITSVTSILFAVLNYKTPLKGVLKPAITSGLDTDTIASMTAGLLGCMRGNSWLLDKINYIQDAQYISDLANKFS